MVDDLTFGLDRVYEIDIISWDQKTLDRAPIWRLIHIPEQNGKIGKNSGD